MKLTFNTKLVLSFAAILIVSILSMGIVANYLMKKNAYELGISISSGIVATTIQALEVKIENQSDVVKLGMEALEKRYESGMNPEEIVTYLLKNFNFYSTVFKKQGNDYVRIATTIPTQDGKSAIGTKLDPNSEAFKSVVQGNVWHGIRILMGYHSIVEYKPLGYDTVLYVGLPIIDQQFVSYLKNQKIHNSGYIFLFEKNGQLAWHPDTKLTGTSISNTSYAPVLLGAQNELVEYETDGKKQYTFVGLHEGSGLRVAFGLTESEIMFGLDKNIAMSGLYGGLAALAIAFVISLIAIANIKKILKKVEEMALGVAEGDYDKKTAYNSKDNIRRILDAMEVMANKIKQQIKDVGVKSEEAMNAKAEAESALKKVQVAQTEIESKNAKILEAAKQAREVSENMSSTAAELSAQVEQVSRGAEHQKKRVTEVATAIEEMSATVLEVAKNASETSSQAEDSNAKANDGMSIMGQTIQSIESIRQIDEVSNQSMKDLSAKADAVGGVVSVIEDIADQTNLLALNAAIEAARAGDAGRGFAVVADEVRKLAEKTMSATKEVGVSINDIQSAVGKNVSERQRAKEALEQTVQSAQRVNEILNLIVSSVSQSAAMASGIATATEEQSAATEQIAKSVEEVDRISTDTSEAMRESAEVVHDLARLAEGLDLIIKSLTDQ